MRSRGQVYGSVPYGWSRDGDRLVKHDKEQSVLARMRKLRAKGTSYDRIARVLNARGTGEARGSLARDVCQVRTSHGSEGGMCQAEATA